MTIFKNSVEYLNNLWYSIFRIGRVSKEVGVMKKGNLTIIDIADFFRKKEKMSHKKLQKLAYYSYAWYIALNNEVKDKINVRICDKCRFEAWVHGPVSPMLYGKYSDNYGVVDKYDGELNENITGEIKKFLETIWKVFGKYSGDELESMTHAEMPWQNARDAIAPYEPSTKEILESDMFEYYNSL